MKKLINLIFADKNEAQNEQQLEWSFERNGWEASARRYNARHGIKRDAV